MAAAPGRSLVARLALSAGDPIARRIRPSPGAMILRRVALWLLAVLVFTLGGLLAGELLDQALWVISYDYVYRAAQFVAGGTRLGLLLGCLTAAAATAGTWPPARAVALLRVAVLTL